MGSECYWPINRDGGKICPDCARQLLSNFWRLEQLFAVLATSGKFYLSKQLVSKIKVYST